MSRGHTFGTLSTRKHLFDAANFPVSPELFSSSSIISVYHLVCTLSTRPGRVFTMAADPSAQHSACWERLQGEYSTRRASDALLQKEEEEKLEEVDDADDVKGTLVELIVKKAREGPPSTVVKPHFGVVDSGGSKTERFKALFGGKHCTFSYNWGVQEQVKAARSEVGAAGVPTWMDIDGEPARGLLPSPRAPADRRGVGPAQAG